MKIVIYILLLSSSLFSFEMNCEAIVRNSKDKLKKKIVKIDNLISSDSFKGQYFSINSGTSEKAVQKNSKLALRACTAYYHLEKARKFFIDHFDINPFEKEKRITVRIEMNQAFDDSVHFLPEKFGTVFNNAITIPPSSRMKLDEIDSWGYEIWFAPKKVIKLKSSLEQSTDILTSPAVMGNLIYSVAEKELTIMIQDLARGVEWNKFSRNFYLQSLMYSVGITALIPNLLKWSSKVSKKKIFLDSGLIPEVIYHEYVHFALANKINIGHSSPVGESVANYFASKISSRNNILKNSRPYMKGLVKIDGSKIKKYKYIFDDSRYAQADFGFKFLHALHKELGSEFDSILVNSLSLIDKRKTLSIKDNLVPAMHLAIFKQNDALLQFKFLNVLQMVGI